MTGLLKKQSFSFVYETKWGWKNELSGNTEGNESI